MTQACANKLHIVAFTEKAVEYKNSVFRFLHFGMQNIYSEFNHLLFNY